MRTQPGNFVAAAYPPQQPTGTPLVFGNYEALALIGSGGMAEVFAARPRGEVRSPSIVAVKSIRSSLVTEPKFVTMFLDEMSIAAQVQSPNVVRTIDQGVTETGAPFLVMELVSGPTLAKLLRAAAPLPIPIVAQVAAHAARGLHDAHEAKGKTGASLEIVHRDMSPQNILMGMDGFVRIMDFGIARATERFTQTQQGEFKGKLSYFSPEQAHGPGVDRRSDIFSLGIVLWEALTAKRLFRGKDVAQTFTNVLKKPVPSPLDYRPDVPLELANVVLRALERDPERRFATAAEMEQAVLHATRDIEIPEPTEFGVWIDELAGNPGAALNGRIAAANELPLGLMADADDLRVSTEMTFSSTEAWNDAAPTIVTNTPMGEDRDPDFANSSESESRTRLKPSFWARLAQGWRSFWR